LNMTWNGTKFYEKLGHALSFKLDTPARGARTYYNFFGTPDING